MTERINELFLWCWTGLVRNFRRLTLVAFSSQITEPFLLALHASYLAKGQNFSEHCRNCSRMDRCFANYDYFLPAALPALDPSNQRFSMKRQLWDFTEMLYTTCKTFLERLLSFAQSLPAIFWFFVVPLLAERKAPTIIDEKQTT